MLPVVATPKSVLISCIYDSTGLEFVMLFDNSLMAWLVDETGAAAPVPVILGAQPEAGPDTTPVFSPSWAVREGPTIFVPDIARGSANEFFNFIATNNGANRLVYANFSDPDLATAWREWITVNPTLALDAPPGTVPEDARMESQRFGGMQDQRPHEIRRDEAAAREAEREREVAAAEQQPAR